MIFKPTSTAESIPPDTTSQFKRQLPRNLLLQALSFLLQVGIGIWLVPYLFNHLGPAAYALIPIAAALTQYVALISQNISSAVNRFLTIALQRDELDEANRIFNTAFFSYLLLGLVQVPVFGLLIYYASSIFTIPAELYHDATILLLCSAGSFLVNLVCSVYMVPILAQNRLDLARGFDIGRLLLRAAAVVTLFLLLDPSLKLVGYVDLSLTALFCAIQIAIGKSLAPALRLQPRFFQSSKVRELMGMGWWLLIHHVGVLLFLRTDIWICNRFISPAAAGDYAAVLQWPMLIREAGGLIGVVVAPMILIYYARSELSNLLHLTRVTLRIFNLALAILISFICVFSRDLLRLWLGPGSEVLAPLLIIMVCHLVVNVGMQPIFNINTAFNRVRLPGIANLVGGILNILMALLFVRLGWGVLGVALAGAIFLTLKNTLFFPLYGAAILQQKWYVFLRPCLAGNLLLICLIGLGSLAAHYFQPQTWLQMAAAFIIFISAGSSIAWLLLTPADRQLAIWIIRRTLGQGQSVPPGNSADFL